MEKPQSQLRKHTINSIANFKAHNHWSLILLKKISNSQIEVLLPFNKAYACMQLELFNILAQRVCVCAACARTYLFTSSNTCKLNIHFPVILQNKTRWSWNEVLLLLSRAYASLQLLFVNIYDNFGLIILRKRIIFYNPAKEKVVLQREVMLYLTKHMRLCSMRPLKSQHNAYAFVLIDIHQSPAILASWRSFLLFCKTKLVNCEKMFCCYWTKHKSVTTLRS